MDDRTEPRNGDIDVTNLLPMLPLAGRVALVTGGGSGIGRATALAFAASGAVVMVADINVTGAEETMLLIHDQDGQAAVVRADVSSSDDVAAMVAATIERFGRLDCAFNNAGIEGSTAFIADYPDEVFDRVIAINLRGVWLCMKHEIAVMLDQGGGAIVNTASIAGLGGFPDVPAYCASKHGVVGLTRSAALSYATQHIRVNAVCPGYIDTPMIERFISPEWTREMAQAANPIGRMGRVDEVAATVVWLCTDAASLITGIAMPVDGGYTAM